MSAIEVFQLDGGVRSPMKLTSITDLFTFGLYPAGEPYVKFNISEAELGVWRRSPVLVQARIRDFVELGYFHECVKALRHGGARDIYGFIPYFPGGRGDRTTWDPIMPATLEMTTTIVNSLQLEKVFVLDGHSPMTRGLLTNAVGMSSATAIQAAVSGKTNLLEFDPFLSRDASVGPIYGHGYSGVIAPDEGSIGRAGDANYALGYGQGDNKRKIFFGKKVRDEATGTLSHFDFEEGSVLSERGRYLMVDDICDGGGTFAGLLARIREEYPAEEYPIDLFVTHGVFSGNYRKNLAGFERVFFTDSLGPNPDFGTQVGIDLYHPYIMRSMNK